ncbi:MAG TPA: TIR domain-containing protein, partial [Thermoanaerobaculia bacterium]
MSHVFISHASADDPFVAELRRALDALQIPVWVDSRELIGGNKLVPEIETAIEQARQFLVVLSPNTVNSPWVRREIRKALEVEKIRGDGYRVIPLLLSGITPGALGTWFDEEPIGVKIEIGPGGLSAALPTLLAALGERLPADFQPFEQPDAKPVEELVLTLTDPVIEISEGTRRAKATATLAYEPARADKRNVVSRRFFFTAPLGPIEAGDLKWYLEQYYLWPVGVFKDRADAIERKLPGWGHDLFQAALGDEEAREALATWQQAADGAERRFSVLVDSDLPKGASEEAQAAAREAATELLALPWEILHDGGAWLFQGRHAVRVRRRLPNRHAQAARLTGLPIQILHVSPRPEKKVNGDLIGYIDHRISALPLSEAVENLGALVRLTFLNPPTYGALEESLRVAADRGQPFDVVHFDGYGVYDLNLGLRGLFFEYPNDEKLKDRRAYFVDAAQLAGLVRQHRIPLIFLQAYQTSVAELSPTTSSVATRLLEEGVASVVAMSYSVVLEMARRFTQAFYGELARGARIGRAMLAGQQELFADNRRGQVWGAGELQLQDWFLPVLYQEKQDPQLITKIPSRQILRQEAQKRRLSFGHLPEPLHQFRGRSPELLEMERLLHREQWAVMRGVGGQGKTMLAAELARWLVRTGRIARAAFVPLDRQGTVPAVLDTLGHQLAGPRYTVAEHSTLDKALQHIERALADQPTLIVLDNCESVLPERGDLADPSDPANLSTSDPATAIFALCRSLLEADPCTRLVFTTREPLPAPFDHRGHELE